MDTGYGESFRKELPDFKEMTEKFYRKEIDTKTYKGYSGRFGSYAQRGGQASMLRLRMSGGRITKEKLKFVADCIGKYQIDRVHFTTCQTIQLHNLDAAAVCAIMEEAVDYGIITWGGGGDFPRNVMTSPMSGVEKDEYFDVIPYVEAAAEYLTGLIDRVKLPRKLKVGFSNSPSNISHATFRDMGFAAREDGLFDVYIAGGLGSNPRMGILVETEVSPDKIIYYIKAMVDTFVAYGNYENRAKARTRYMQASLGADGLSKAYQEKLRQAFAAEEDLTLCISAEAVTKQGDGICVSHRRAIAQKQEGLYAVEYHPAGGTPVPEKLAELYEAVKDMDQAELRLAPDETLYLINLSGREAEKILELTDDGAANLFESSVACIGAEICQVGVRDSQKLIKTLINRTRECGFRDGVLPKIHISGCPSSCGTHQIGVIGFHGGVKMVDKLPLPAFTLHINGNEEEKNERFGEQLGVILERDIPDFLIEVGKEVEASGGTYETWISENPDRIKMAASKFLMA